MSHAQSNGASPIYVAGYQGLVRHFWGSGVLLLLARTLSERDIGEQRV